MRLASLLLLLTVCAPVVHAQSGKSDDKAGLPSAQAVLQAHLDATGGADAWAAIRSLRSEGVRLMDGPMGGGKQSSRFVETVRYPGYAHTHRAMDTPMGAMEVVQVSTPEGNWVEAAQIGHRALPVRPGETLRLAGPSEEWTLLNDPAYDLGAVEAGTFEGTLVYTVTVELDGTTTRRHYDRASGLLRAVERLGGDEPATYAFGDYRRVGAVLLPHSRVEDVTARLVVRDAGGEETETVHQVESQVTVERFELNPEVDADLFVGSE